MKNSKILVQRKIQKKSDFVFKGFITDITKLEYFFEKFFEIRNNSGRYPTIEKWRENLVKELIEDINENEIKEFDIGEISNITSSEHLKKSIYKWQKNKIYVFDYGFNFLLNLHKKNEIPIYFDSVINFPNIIQSSLEEIIFSSDYGLNNLNLSFTKYLELGLSDKNFESNIFLQYNNANFEKRLFDLIQNLKAGYDISFELDRIFLSIGYTISRDNIFFNNKELNFYVINNEFANSRSFQNKNLIAKKYKEISQMLLKLLNKDEKDLLSLRYGLNNLNRHTLKEIYIIKNYHNYQNLYEDLVRTLWKIRIIWPREIIEKILFGEFKTNIHDEFKAYFLESSY